MLSLAALLAAPEEPPPPPPEPIIVTGRGLRETPATPAYATTVLEREALIRAPSGRIEDALAGVAGFQQFRRSDSRASNPSAQGVTLRALGGNATSRALVTLDGVPMADPFFGYIPLSALAPERLASASVTRGGGSGPFGAGALAGTIALVSADAEELGLASGALFASDRGDSELSATLAPQLGQGFAIVSARWDRGEGFLTTPPEQRVPASAKARYDSWSARLRGVARLGGATELQAQLLAFRDTRTLRFRGADSLSEGQDASLRLIGRGRWQWEALAYVQARDFTNIVVSATRFVPTLDQRATPSTGLGGKLELRPPLPPGHVLRFGADYRRSSGSLAEDALSAATGVVTERRSAGGTNSDLGLFAEHDWRAGALTLTGGLRADRFAISDGFFAATAPDGEVLTSARFPDRAGWAASVRGGALLRLAGGWRLRAAGYTGLRLPTLNELYRPFVVFPVTTRANAALGNERLVGFEAGVDFVLPGRLSVSVTGFDNRIEDAIANVTLTPTLRERRNIDRIAARGLEASLTAMRGPFALDASLALTDALALEGKRPAQTPALAASATLTWQPAPGHQLALTLRHTGAQFEDDLESERLPPATTLSAFAAWPLAVRLSLVLRAENLTDTRIVTRNQAGSIDLGTPRTLWAGVRWGL
ncbi:TonB-dependent receptor [Qipengyuania sediminis]|uniref:TonB-dependent receptor n=1 Tax=Qipengyuania sediminis TaxID=1532023 RepID=UPI001059CBF7|nr:TonB-dependent receptor [Qipengyuania sediminis]